MKPLELDIWERTTCADGCGDRTWLNTRTGVEIDRDRRDHSPNLTRRDYNPAKRLTDAELAAEYQRECRMYERARFSSLASGGSHIPAEWLNYLNRMETFERFATHPHYDEADQ